MKKVVSALTAAAMCASMAAGAISAFAVYTPEEIAFSLEVVSTGDYTVDGNTITFASAEAAQNATFTVAQYIEADNDPAKADFQMIGTRVVASDMAINLADAPVDPTNGAYNATAVEYTAADGTVFSTKYFVTCFSYLNAMGRFKTGVMAWTATHSDGFNFDYSGPDQLSWMWQYSFDASVYENYKETAHFFGTTSDEYPLTQFDVTLGADIAEGTYSIDFAETFDAGEGEQLATYITPSSWKGDGTFGTSYTPTLKNLTIQIGEATSEPTTEPDTTEPGTTEPTTVVDPTQGEVTDPGTSMDGFTWYIEKVTGAVAGEYVPVHVYVANDPGTAGYDLSISFDGGSIADSDLTILDIVQGNDAGDSNTYLEFGMFAQNPDTAAIASSRGDGADSIAVDGEAVFVMYVQIPEGVADGTTYVLDFAELAVSNGAYETLSPNTIAGSITVGEVTEPDTTEPDTTEPDTTEPDTTEPDTTEPDTTEPTTDVPTTVPGEYLYGDVNKNGVVELVDIVMLNRYLTKYADQTLDAYQTEVADCYDDGALAGTDSMEILKYLLGMLTSLPTAAN